MRSDFKLNGISIKTPHDVQRSLFKVSDAERLASGLMAMDIVALKHKYTFKYNAITASDFQVITDILFSMDSFFTLTFNEDNEAKTFTVYVGEIPATLHRTSDADWVWRDITFSLIER